MGIPILIMGESGSGECSVIIEDGYSNNYETAQAINKPWRAGKF